MFVLQVSATLMGSNETGIGSPIPPVSEVESASVCGCESWRLTSEGAVVIVCLFVLCWENDTRQISIVTHRDEKKQGLSEEDAAK